MNNCALIAWIALIGWIITIIGYFYTSKTANNRETRKEVRNEIDMLLHEIDKLLESSHEYYCSSDVASRTIAQSQIQTRFNRLDGLVERLEEHDKSSTLKIEKYFKELFEEITGGNFGSSEFMPNCEVYAEKSKVLAIKAESIRTNCESWFTRSFQS